MNIFDKKVFVMDMDGTLYLGNNVIPGAPEFVERVRAHGSRVLFFTNNASRNRGLYVEKLTKLGFKAVPEDIVTSGDVTIDFLLKNRKGKSVYLLGTPPLIEDFRKAGIKLTNIGENADIVVSSFDTTLTYEKLKNACNLIRGGAEFLSTHEDINCPVENGFIPDSGAICELIKTSTGVSPRYFGKPNGETPDYVEGFTGVDRADMVFIGDRLYTDIKTGKLHGILTAFVLSGEGTMEDVNALPESLKPDLIYKSVDEIR